MRSLTIVRDQDGAIKIAQFGNVWDQPSGWGESDPNAFPKACDFFTQYVDNRERLDLLEKKIQHIKFFSEQEYIEFNKKIRANNKSAWIYDDEFLDAQVGVYILDKADKFTARTRLTSYYKYVGDTMFASVTFEIDFSQGLARILNNGREIYRNQFRDARETRFTAKQKKRQLRKESEEPVVTSAQGKKLSYYMKRKLKQQALAAQQNNEEKSNA